MLENSNDIKDDNLSNANTTQFIDYMQLQSTVNESEKLRLDNLYKSENKRKHSVLFYVGIVYFLLITLLIGVRILNSLGVLGTFNYYVNEIISTSIIQILIMFAIPITSFSVIKKQKVKQTFSDFKYKKISGSIVLISIVIGVLVFWLNGFISSLFAFLISVFGYETAPAQTTSVAIDTGSFWYIFLTIVCSCVLPAICEETAHRGMLLTALKRYGVGRAILISGLMFGLLHLSINQFFYAAIIGCFLAFLTVVSNSIYPAMIVHFMNNFLSNCSDILVSNGYDIFSLQKFLDYLESIFGAWLSNFIVFIVLIGSIFLIIYLVYAIYKRRTCMVVLEKIKNENVAFFYNFDNLDENGNLKSDAFKRFFNAPNTEVSSLLYLSDQSKFNRKKRIMDYFEDVYNDDKVKGLFNWVFIISAIVLSSLVTIFTFVWGVL